MMLPENLLPQYSGTKGAGEIQEHIMSLSISPLWTRMSLNMSANRMYYSITIAYYMLFIITYCLLYVVQRYIVVKTCSNRDCS